MTLESPIECIRHFVKEYHYPFSAHALEGLTNFYSNKVYNLVTDTAHGEPIAIMPTT